MFINIKNVFFFFFIGDFDPRSLAQAERFARKLKSGPHVGLKVYEDPGEIAEVWEMRESGVGHSKVPGDHPGWPSWEDSAVAPEQTGDYLRDLERLLEKHGRRSAAYSPWQKQGDPAANRPVPDKPPARMPYAD